jgi:TM2 domain-containing membrane protein YozV
MVDFCQYADHSGLKSRAVATILAGFGGFLGLDCFYLGKTGKGFGRIAANLGFGLGGIIWSLIDLYTYADGRGTDAQGRKLV